MHRCRTGHEPREQRHEFTRRNIIGVRRRVTHRCLCSPHIRAAQRIAALAKKRPLVCHAVSADNAVVPTEPALEELRSGGPTNHACNAGGARDVQGKFGVHRSQKHQLWTSATAEADLATALPSNRLRMHDRVRQTAHVRTTTPCLTSLRNPRVEPSLLHNTGPHCYVSILT